MITSSKLSKAKISKLVSKLIENLNNFNSKSNQNEKLASNKKLLEVIIINIFLDWEMRKF